MEDKDLDVTGAENTEEGKQEETHEEKHENMLQHLIHEIKDEVHDLFDLDTFLHGGGSITGGITGETEAEQEGE